MPLGPLSLQRFFGNPQDREPVPRRRTLVSTTIVLTKLVRTAMMGSMKLPRSAAVRSARFDSPEQEAYLHLWRTYDRLRSLEDELFAQYDLSAQQYNTLRLLKAAHPGTVPTLALGAQLISRAPDMTRLLDKLEDRGLVWRERRPENRRVVEIGITGAGLELLAALAEPVRVCHQRQFGHLSAKQLALLVELLSAARSPHEDPQRPWAGDETSEAARGANA